MQEHLFRFFRFYQQANYCTRTCHYTHDYVNPSCANIPTPPACSVPAANVTPPVPCDPQCGAGEQSLFYRALLLATVPLLLYAALPPQAYTVGSASVMAAVCVGGAGLDPTLVM